MVTDEYQDTVIHFTLEQMIILQDCYANTKTHIINQAKIEHFCGLQKVNDTWSAYKIVDTKKYFLSKLKHGL